MKCLSSAFLVSERELGITKSTHIYHVVKTSKAKKGLLSLKRILDEEEMAVHFLCINVMENRRSWTIKVEK